MLKQGARTVTDVNMVLSTVRCPIEQAHNCSGKLVTDSRGA